MALRLLIAILILAVPVELPGCGPYLTKALFHLTVGPEAPAEFAHGQLGILQPAYERLYQVIAYRYLSGVGLNDAERQTILPPPKPAVDTNPWLVARNKAPGITPLRQLDPYRQVKKEGYFDTYLNCNDDAFRTAAATLERIQQTGAAAEWIAAQDVVFSNCSRGAAIPQPASDPRMRADRAYQIASAKFYSEQYGDARQDFQTIAADASSPWHGVAPYLAARCLIRAGQFAEAETELRSVAADPALTRWHAPAGRLLDYVEAHLHPAERMHQLALALVRPDSEATIGQDLIDYRMLFDRNIAPQPNDDLADWIRSFQAGGAGAVERWRARHTLPWLVAALAASKPGDADVPELLAAASEVKSDSPAYLTVNYHRVRLLPPDDAGALAGRLLAGKMPTSARNQFRAERMRLARDFEEFLRYAPRRPVAESDYEVKAVDTSEDLLDEDAAVILDNDIPLALLRQASTSPLLPDVVRQKLKNVISVRMLLLARAPSFDGVFAVLKTPGVRLHVDSGYGRNTEDLTKIDPFRDNWWCSSGIAQEYRPYGPVLFQRDSPSALFLSAADRAQAAAEWQKLQSLPTAPDWLAAQTLAFARAHPQDPRIPEALYLLVRATRFGCTGGQTGDLSHRAFDLLHRRYPKTEWAAKTPYWFK
ncbi:MAG: tetratricopeptide repeat protein [Bryobacteraceae bacterium]